MERANQSNDKVLQPEELWLVTQQLALQEARQKQKRGIPKSIVGLFLGLVPLRSTTGLQATVHKNKTAAAHGRQTPRGRLLHAGPFRGQLPVSVPYDAPHSCRPRGVRAVVDDHSGSRPLADRALLRPNPSVAWPNAAH